MSPRERRVKVALAVLVVVLLAGSVYQHAVIQEKEGRVDELSGELNDTRQLLNVTRSALQGEQAENQRLRGELTERENTITSLRRELGVAERRVRELTPQTMEYAVVGVKGDGEGVVIPLEVKIVGGSGSIAVNIRNVDTKPGVQESIRTAVGVAEDYTGESLADDDITVTFANRRDEVVVIDGGSAGAAIATTIVAATRNRTPREGVLMTGAILGNGRIGEVGGVREKAEAAADYGAERFLVPDGQFTSVSGLEVIEVDDIDEVVGRVLAR